MMYYIQKTGQYLDDLVLWWKKGDGGYTVNLKDARIFTEKQAREICLKPNSDKLRWPTEYVEEGTETYKYDHNKGEYLLWDEGEGSITCVDRNMCEEEVGDAHNDKLIMRAITCMEWMIQDMKHRSDQVSPDNYSPELLEAMETLEELTS